MGFLNLVRVVRFSFHDGREKQGRFIAPHSGSRYTRVPSLPALPVRGHVEQFFQFDAAYVSRLREGDPSTEEHFTGYFDPLLRIMLRTRFIPPDRIDDLVQDTFIRVIAALRKEDGVRQPERFGAFVNSIAKNVLYEFYRSGRRTEPLEETHMKIADKAVDLDGMLITQQTKKLVADVLTSMPARDRDLLKALFLEEKEKEEVCQTFGIDRDYLRVCLLRAKVRFRVLLEKHQGRVSRETPVKDIR
jgi:RNA polymerase sigma-70 factor, ECF subfamily